MRNLLKQNQIFLIAYLIILIAGLIPVMMYPRTDLHLFLNQFHAPYADLFFKYVTFLGSGITAFILCLILIFIRIRYSIVMFASWTGAGIVVQLLKHLIFPGFDRPVKVFETISGLHLVQGIEFHDHFSFPSGHAATALAIFGLLAMITTRKWLKMVFLLCAVIVSYSRVYLSQHFLEDILLGSAIGILAVIIFYWYFHHLKMSRTDHPVQYYFRKEKQ
jgi:membrane-associated phospholipid phosphatase